MTKIITFTNRIIVEYVEEDESEGGVALSQVSSQKPSKGVVVAVGPGKVDRHGNFVQVDVKEGDVVHFDPFAPRTLELKGKKYLVIKDDDLLAQDA